MSPKELQLILDLASELEFEAQRITEWVIDNKDGPNWTRLKWSEGHIDGLMFAVDTIKGLVKALSPETKEASRNFVSLK